MDQPVDAKAYYAYLFEPDKKPTKVLDALLRSIAIYVSQNVGDKAEKHLTPAKMADFYKDMGGNYDSLFVEVPHASISWIYASIGCQHTFQPTDNDFKPPSVPALTTKGFVRWQSIEILLGPEEHVPFIQTAVKTWGLKHPDTGEAFPVDLPREAFPLHCDQQVEKWHSDCAAKLRQEANPDVDDHESRRPDLPPRPRVRVQTGYSHVHARAQPHHHPSRANTVHHVESRSRTSARPLSYSHVSGTGGRPVRPALSRSPEYRPRQFLVPEERIPPSPLSHGRRRSFPENLSSPLSTPSEKHEEILHPPPAPQYVRRHSHPRHRHASSAEDTSSEDEGSHSPKTTAVKGSSRPTSHHSSPVEDVPGPARMNPAAPTPPDPRRDRREREEEIRRQNFSIPIDLNGKLSAPFMLHKDRERNSRSGSRGVRWKDLSPDIWKSASKESSQEEEVHSRHSREDLRRRDRISERDREREREREKDRGRDRDRDRDREARPRLAPRRPSSHNDILRPGRDRRDRDSEYPDRDRRSFKDRDRERRAMSPVGGVGVNGRRYPSQV